MSPNLLLYGLYSTVVLALSQTPVYIAAQGLSNYHGLLCQTCDNIWFGFSSHKVEVLGTQEQ
jgi:hypothetical protein